MPYDIKDEILNLIINNLSDVGLYNLYHLSVSMVFQTMRFGWLLVGDGTTLAKSREFSLPEAELEGAHLASCFPLGLSRAFSLL